MPSERPPWQAADQTLWCIKRRHGRINLGCLSDDILNSRS
jgi:hypothetical protein